MQTPRIGEKLMKLPGTSTVFGKLRAVLQSSGAFFAGSEQIESVSACEITEQRRASLSVECAKAAAELLAYNLRQRIM